MKREKGEKRRDHVWVVLPSSYYDPHRLCNTNHPASLQSTLFLLVIFFRIPVSFRSINHLTAFCILLDGVVNKGTSQLFIIPTSLPSSKMLSKLCRIPTQIFILAVLYYCNKEWTSSAKHQTTSIHCLMAYQYFITLPSQSTSQFLLYF